MKETVLRTKLSVIMALLCMLSIVFAPIKTKADTQMGKVEDELKTTATYMMDTTLADTVLKDGYKAHYSDYYSAMLCIKAGVTNDKVLETMDTLLAAQVKDYNAETFLGTQSGTLSYSLAVSILYLQERGEDVTDYQDKNLVGLLEEEFTTEISKDINPYVYQLVAAVADNVDTDMTKVKDLIKTNVLNVYVENESGTGIDCWGGYGVSVDDNGQVLAALIDVYGTDDEVKEKIDKAAAWNLAQKDESGAISSFGAPSVNSTALALKLAAQTGKMEECEIYYNALSQFKSATSEGAYKGYNGDPDASVTSDVVLGMMAYRNATQSRTLFEVVNKDKADDESQDTDNADNNNTSGNNANNDNDVNIIVYIVLALIGVGVIAGLIVGIKEFLG